MTTLTLLQTVQEVARRHGILSPSAVVTSQDETIQQLWGLANETVEELNERYRWVELITPYTFIHANATDYAALVIKGPTATVTDWRNYMVDTLWSTTESLQLIGPVSEKDWQATVNLQIAAGRYQFRFYMNALCIYPVPTVPADVTFRLEYYSSCPIIAVDGTTKKELFSADTDYCRLPSRLVTLGLRWRYKKEKGLPYAEDKDTYELAVADLTANTGQQNKVKLDQDTFSDTPGPMIIVPPGSWPV